MKKVYMIMKAVEGIDVVLDVYMDEGKRDERLEFYREYGCEPGLYYKMDMKLSD